MKFKTAPQIEILDYNDGLARFCGKAELYRKYLLKFWKEPLYGQLCAAMEQNNYPEAFRCAHALKGCVGNLSLVRLYHAVAVLVETLRTEARYSEAPQAMHEVKAAYEASLCEVRRVMSV